MNIINITNSAIAVMLLSTSMVSADTQYPAADFQPKVVYQDPDYKPTQSSAGASSAQAGAGTASTSDSQYPAANFQPKVVYSDPSYKHSSPAPAATGSMQTSAESSENASDSGQKEESSSNYLIGLIVLALVGVVLFRKKSPEARESAASRSSYRAGSGSVGGLTGVAKYINRKAGTGVSRYLETQVKSAASSTAATGVAKYMAKQAESAKTSASQAATGVEKYMRNRG